MTSLGRTALGLPARQVPIFLLPCTGPQQVLLHAATCHRLGLLAYDLHGSNVPLLSLPGLPCGADKQWMRRYEVAATDGPFAMAAAATTISSFEELRAHVKVADANIGKILEDCGDDPFPKVVFSLEQVRQLKAICVTYKSVFATSKIPHANDRPSVQVELLPDPPEARWTAKPHHWPPPLWWAVHARRYLNKLRQFWLAEGWWFQTRTGAGRHVSVSSGRARRTRFVGTRHCVPQRMPTLSTSSRFRTHMTCRMGPQRWRRRQGDVYIPSAPTRTQLSQASAFTKTVWLPLSDLPSDGAGNFKAKRLHHQKKFARLF